MNKILILLILIMLLIIGCDSNKSENVKTKIESYINTTETVKVNSYNGYKLIDLDKVKNEDGSITVILKFDKIIN